MDHSVEYLAPPLRVDSGDERVWLDGEIVGLGHKPFALLVSLMSSPQRMRSKNELIEEVWEGRAVSDAVLTTAMKELRRALNDDARAPEFIETVHGRGYRFLKPVQRKIVELQARESTAAVTSVQQADPIQRYPASPIVIAVLGALILVLIWWILPGSSPDTRETFPDVPPSSIAVLPFEDLSQDGDQAYFAKGLSEEIINVLVRVDELKVASRTSSFSFVDRNDLLIRDIGRELGVRHVLEGSVRTTGNRVRVTAQLIEAESDVHHWSDTFERELTVENLFAIQDEISNEIVDALDEILNTSLAIPEQSLRAGTGDIDAYDAYLRAKELFVNRSDLNRALVYARSAVAIDPNFSRGWEMLASIAFVRGGDATAEAQVAVATALQLDPNLSLAHAIRGVMNNIDPPYNWSATISDLERALELDPKNTSALLWLGIEMRKLGFLDRAVTLFERCLNADPAYHRCKAHLLWTLHMNGSTDEAIGRYRELVSEGAPPDDAVLLLEAIRRGDIAFADEIVRSISNDTELPGIVYTALKASDFENGAAKEALVNWVNAASLNRRDVYPIILAFGEYDLILQEQGSFFGLWLPEFDEYRKSEAFKEFVERLRINAYWRSHGYPKQCQPMSATEFRCGN